MSNLIYKVDDMKNRYNVYEGKYCIKKFSEFLKRHAMEIILKKKKIIVLLTKKELESYASQENCQICKKTF